MMSFVIRIESKRGGDYVQHELAAVMDNPNLIEWGLPLRTRMLGL